MDIKEVANMDNTRQLIREYNSLAVTIMENSSIENSEKWEMLEKLKELGNKINELMEKR